MSKLSIPLVVGDALAMTSIVWVGRISHAENMFDLVDTLRVATPFILGWLIVMPWFGLFSPQVYRNWQQLILRVIAGWGLVGLPLAMVLRALTLMVTDGRTFAASFILSFFITMFITTSLTLLLWRTIWNKTQSQSLSKGTAS